MLIRHVQTAVNFISQRGSALHLAVYNQNLKICQVLLLADSSLIQAKDSSGKSVLDLNTNNLTQAIKNLLDIYRNQQSSDDQVSFVEELKSNAA